MPNDPYNTPRRPLDHAELAAYNAEIFVQPPGLRGRHHRHLRHLPQRDPRPRQAAVRTVQKGQAMNMPKPPAWVDHALCAQIGADDWFPDHEATSTAAARAICAQCEVRTACLDYALANDEPHGVWGGFGAAERRKLRRSVA